jgi:AcrR family transcriptional regulator
MKVSEYIKSQGLSGRKYVADAVNVTPPTINNWYRDNFALLEAVVIGLAEKKFREEVL